MNHKLKIFFSLIFAATMPICIVSLNSTDVQAGYGTGGAPGHTNPTPSDCGSEWQNFCCFEVEHCPQWLLVTKETYNDIIEEGRVHGDYSGLDTCQNDEYVVITGNYKPDGNLWINNITGSSRPNPYKETYSFLNFDVDWSANGNKWGFMDIKAGTYNGKDITYGQLMEKIMKENKVTEENLAVFCMATIKQPEYTRRLTLVGSSDPEADFPSNGSWTKNSSIIKNNIINYNYGGFSSGVDTKKVSGGSTYNSATAPKTLSVDDVSYTINRVIATEYGEKKTDCNNDDISFKHLQSDAYKSSGVIDGCQDIYIIYSKPNVTLNAYAISTDKKTFLNGGEKLTTNPASMPVNNGTSVSVTQPGFSGYNFKGWYPASSNSKEGCKTYTSLATSDNTFTTTLTTSGTMCAVYEINKSFNARAIASENATWSDNNSTNSGFKKGDASAETYPMQCSSDGGCTAYFWLDLKTVSGTGSTTYTIQKSTDGGNTWSNVSGMVNKTSSPSSGSEGTNVYKTSEKISIGSTVCYQINYHPHGTEASSVTKNIFACVKAEPSTFIGKTEVSGAASATAGWTNATSPKKESVTTSIENCSPTDGCKVSFKHSLQRKSGIAATTYNVYRSSNLVTSTRAISADTIIGDTSFSSNKEEAVSESKNLKLYPGMVVCEKLTFKPNNLPATTGNIYTQVCVHAHGNAQPPDPSNPDEPEDPDKDSGDTSFINIKVSNPSAATKYHNYQREVYAKPGDILSFRATYNPVLQYTYFLVPQKMCIDCDDDDDDAIIYPTSGINSTMQLGNLFNTHKGSNLKNWNNAFSVQSGTNNAFGTLVADYNEYNNGETAKKQEINTYTVDASHVGKSINEKAITNLNSTTQTTPSQVNFRDDNSDANRANLANVITVGKSKIAYARVPFNFKNDTELIDPDELEAYAGEPLTVKYSYIIMPKTNSETSPSEAYSTRVDKPQWRLAVKIGGGTWEYTEPQTQNSFSVSASKMKTNTNYELSTTINIPDVVAGTEICIVPTVYPTNSGADTNYTDKEGSHAWTEIDTSKQKCFNVAKKPNIEVWGGNVYSRGVIKTSISAKNNLEGYTTYNLNGSSVSGKNRYIFGSWVESGLISNGAVSGLASGAGTGFATNDNGTLWPAYSFGNNYNGIGNNASVSGGEPKPGGSYEEIQNFCIRSTLTFANNDCKRGLAGNFSSATSINSIENDKASVLRKFIPASYDENTAGDVALNDDTKIAGNGSYYYYGKDSLTIPETIGIRKGTIQVVHSDQSITIDGDLVYDSAGGYATLEEIPKLVIYAQNVNIACTVSRIDALIIAENQVNTCNSNDVNNSDNSNQLKINGAIITNSLEAKRTYGAATGANSIIPAEIINFDPSLYLWGGNDRQGETSANDMDTTYIHEMAPRY